MAPPVGRYAVGCLAARTRVDQSHSDSGLSRGHRTLELLERGEVIDEIGFVDAGAVHGSELREQVPEVADCQRRRLRRFSGL
jgi:hypothetical protein